MKPQLLAARLQRWQPVGMLRVGPVGVLGENMTALSRLSGAWPFGPVKLVGSKLQ